MKKLPTKSWFKAMNRLSAEKYSKKISQELNERPDLRALITEPKILSFLKWAGEQRLDFTPDLEEEVKDFTEGRLGYRVRMFNTNVKAWKKITAEVFERDNYTCQYCGERGGILECDHKIPFSKGGSDDMENLTTSCRKCNRSKRDKTHLQFLNTTS